MTQTLESVLPIVDAAGQVGIPVLLRGGSGIGKTSALTHLAKARGEHLEVITASLYEPSDFGGLPVVHEGEVNLAPMPWVRRVVNEDRSSRILFDEVNLAPPAVQGALLRVLLEGVSGDTKLPAGTKFVAAMNPTRASAGGWDLPAPVAGRFLHLDIDVDAQAWIAGMLSGWAGTPAHVTSNTPTVQASAEARARVVAFIATRPDLLHVQPTDPAAAAGAWPSPRKWDWVTQLLPRLDAWPDLTLAAVDGLVGRQAADAFFTWVDEVNLPSTAVVLADPTSFDWAEQPAEWVLAVVTAVVASASESAAVYTAAGRVLSLVVEAGRADVALPVVKSYLGAAPAGVRPPAALSASFAPLLRRSGKLGH